MQGRPPPAHTRLLLHADLLCRRVLDARLDPLARAQALPARLRGGVVRRLAEALLERAARVRAGVHLPRARGHGVLLLERLLVLLLVRGLKADALRQWGQIVRSPPRLVSSPRVDRQSAAQSRTWPRFAAVSVSLNCRQRPSARSSSICGLQPARHGAGSETQTTQLLDATLHSAGSGECGLQLHKRADV